MEHGISSILEGWGSMVLWMLGHLDMLNYLKSCWQLKEDSIAFKNHDFRIPYIKLYEIICKVFAIGVSKADLQLSCSNRVHFEN